MELKLNEKTIKLTSEQVAAVKLLIKEKTSLLTGGPGTGKTTIIAAVIQELRKQDPSLKIGLCAPTGKAAKRMEEALPSHLKTFLGQRGSLPKTIHRLCEYSPSEGWGRDKDYPLEFDFLIIDETSMLSNDWAKSLCDAIRPSTQVLWVGDADQLPPVGVGAFFHDLLNSNVVPIAKLTKILRQQEDAGGIVEASHLINTCKPDFLGKINQKDFRWIDRENDSQLLNFIETVCSKENTQSDYWIKPDIILSPQRKGSLGVISLNKLLKEKLNPARKGLRSITLPCGDFVSEGDPVMHIKNNYILNIFNGYMGKITKITKDSILVDYDEDQGEIEYPFEFWNELVLAYATTVHKAQGSEFDSGIVIAHPQHSYMLNRNLLYTGISRMKKNCLLLGPLKAIKLACRKQALQRQTRLPWLLKQPESSVNLNL